MINVREDLFFGTTEEELKKIDFFNKEILFTNNARDAYEFSKRKALEVLSQQAIIHINYGYYQGNGEKLIKLGKEGIEARKLGVSRNFGGGEIRVYKGEGISGIDYFRIIYL